MVLISFSFDSLMGDSHQFNLQPHSNRQLIWACFQLSSSAQNYSTTAAGMGKDQQTLMEASFKF